MQSAMNNNTKSRAPSRPQQQRRTGAKSVESGAASESASSTGNDDNACVVCFKNVEIYSIGDCDHPVCYECSTRMRVLCQQNECPICRHLLFKVLFTLEKLPYRELECSNRSDFYSKKYRIGFCSAEIQQKFFQLLDHPCPKCEVPPYRTFPALRNHVRREHNLLYCDLCVDTLKIFTFERRCYTQAELHLHNTKGDTDNRSHRGHPLCEYCNQRYVDRDELFRHLRREHYFCHFCDAEGCNEFYNKYEDLADHFRKEHFLCEEGKCATEEFIGAFRNEIEYKAHVSSVHSKSLNKQQAKQTRTLQLEITLGPRGRSGQTEQGIANMRSRNDELHDYMEEFASTSTHRSQPVTIDAGNEEEFPLLGGVAPGPNVSLLRPPPPSMRHLSGTSGLARTKENFPALGGGGGGGGGGSSSSNSASAARATHSQPVSAVFKKSANAPGAVGRVNAPANGMLLHVSNRPSASGGKKSTNLDFPALSSGKGKKSTRNLEEDMLPSNTGVAISNVSAKHWLTLVDDYVSVANPSNYKKIQMVQKEEEEARARLEAAKKSAPKLTTADFPTLGPSSSKATVKQSSAASSLNWSKPSSEKKQRELENRKAKVAPPPVLPSNKGNGNNNKSNHGLEQTSSKKDKKPKEKLNNQENHPKVNGSKQKEKNNNNNNNNEQKPPITNATNANENLQAGMRAPPGFNGDSPLKPPPGFMSKVTINSVAKLPNKMTFTSSLGESYSIVPSTQTYSDPPDATARNQKLVDQFKNIQTPEAFNEFRLLSQKFRDGSCTVDHYYDHCKHTMKDEFNKLFPELLAMLPDISKQQELYLVHKQNMNMLTPTEQKSLPNLEVCNTCKQILLASDVRSHKNVHELKNTFPKLGTGVSGGENNHAQQK